MYIVYVKNAGKPRKKNGGRDLPPAAVYFKTIAVCK